MMRETQAEKWRILKDVASRVLEWLNSQQHYHDMYAVHFVPHFAPPAPHESLEVYLFYEKNDSIVKCQSTGLSKLIEGRVLSELGNLGYGDLSKIPVHFEFDSHENVVNNFQGNYFNRLR